MFYQFNDLLLAKNKPDKIMFVNSPDMGRIVILALAKELSLTAGCDILVFASPARGATFLE